jgi:hypothetical protein
MKFRRKPKTADVQLPIESNDDFVLAMFRGCTFGPGFTLTLPSGRQLTGDEAQAFTSAFEPSDDVG